MWGLDWTKQNKVKQTEKNDLRVMMIVTMIIIAMKTTTNNNSSSNNNYNNHNNNDYNKNNDIMKIGSYAKTTINNLSY